MQLRRQLRRRSLRNEPSPPKRLKIKRYDLFAAQCITPIVRLLVCAEDAANEALLARGNPIDGALSLDNADQLYCIDCISPPLAPMSGVCVCVAGGGDVCFV